MLIEKQINKFIEKFLEKEGLEKEDFDYYWVADRVGGVVNIGDNFFHFEDIIFDMKTNQPIDNIFNWQNAITDKMISDPNFKHQNYNTWCMNGNKLLEIL